MTPELDPKNFNALAKAYGAESAKDLLGTFLNDARQQVDAITAAVAAGDALRLRHAAHQLKSGSAMLGALAMSADCAQLESLGRAGQTVPATELVQQLQQRFQRVQIEIGVLLSVSS